MPYWMFLIVFWIIILAPVIFSVLAIMGIISFVDKLTAKPKAPPYVPTPEEKAASMARSLEMFAQAEKSRLAHHH
jgi:hypothetical protein